MSNESLTKNIGFISFRFAGTDGVTLEAAKWAEVFQEFGWKCFYLSGEFDAGALPDNYQLDPLFQFHHPDIQAIYQEVFGDKVVRDQDITKRLHVLRDTLKLTLYDFVKRFDIAMINVQNALTIPLNLPLGMALTEFISETGIKCICHHHDFFWERKRFITNSVMDILYSCYPPNIPNVAHVVINSEARANLALRTGINSTLIPNVMPFEREAPRKDAYNADFKESIGVAPDELFFLQPTRVVQRKGIEHAVELVARIKQLNPTKKPVLVISHASGDEGFEYQNRLLEYVKLLNVHAIFESEKILDKRATRNGAKYYSLEDAYQYADIVTYPSLFEGFGNAFLEAIYFRKPIVVNNYSIYAKDMKPLGFDVIEFNNFISQKTVEDACSIMDNPTRIAQMVETNYQIALQYFSFAVLRTRLRYIINELWGSKFDALG